MTVASAYPRIAVLRGGSRNHKASIASGYGILDSLKRIEKDAIDVYIDEDGTWHVRGVVTEPHHVFSQVDGYVDTTELEGPHIDLAKRMGVHRLLHGYDNEMHSDREVLYRLLHQADIATPLTKVVRVKDPSSHSSLKTIWNTLHTPYLVRPLTYTVKKSFFVDSFLKLVEAYEYFSAHDIDFHILSYTNTRPTSIAVLPEYRGELLYIPMPVVALVGNRELPHQATRLLLDKKTDTELATLKELARKVYSITSLSGPALIDVIETKQGLVVVDVQAQPSLRSDGRFMQALQSTGVELGHYLVTRFE
jgi:D-alanine-D-alanine ligase-like ATP-grasp enzyme